MMPEKKVDLNVRTDYDALKYMCSYGPTALKICSLSIQMYL